VQCFPETGSLLDPKDLKPSPWIEDTSKALGMYNTGKTTDDGCPIIGTVFSTDRYKEGLTGFVDFKGLIDFNPRIVPFVQFNYQVLGYSVSTAGCYARTYGR
jgi:hypothetical protein